MSKYDPDFAATVLLEAVYTTDAAACARYGIADRTLRNYRQRLVTDPALAGIFRTKKDALDAAWAEQLPVALRKGIDTLAECVEAVRLDEKAKKDPNVIHAVSGAMKICAEMQLTSKVIDARFAANNRPAGELSSEVRPAAEDRPN